MISKLLDGFSSSRQGRVFTVSQPRSTSHLDEILTDLTFGTLSS